MDPYFVPVSTDVLEKIKNELNIKDEAKFEHTVRLFEEWVSFQTYLPQNYDRALLRTYLRLCKHDLEKAKVKFKNYLVNVSKLPQLFGKRLLCLEPENTISRYMHWYPLPELTSDGYRVTFIKVLNPDPNVMDLRRIIQTITVHADYRMHKEEMSAGEIFLTDAELLHGGHMPVFINTTVKKCIELALESYPLRIKAIHIIANMPIVIHGVNIFKAFFQEDLRKKLHVHRNIQSVLQHIPLKCLPSDYGGAQKSLMEIGAEATKMLKNASDIFENVESLKTIGPIPKEADTSSSIEFGVQGSFRQLNVD